MTSQTDQMKKTLIPIAVGIVLVLGVLWIIKKTVPTPDDHSHAITHEGEITPDFVLHSLNGEPVSRSKLGKKLIMLNFWATWCDACVIEMPSIQKLYVKYKDQGFSVAAISVDAEPNAVLPKFLQRFQFTFPIYIDQDQELSALFGVHGIPHTVILNGEGKVLYIETGDRNWFSSEVQEQIEKWLNT